MPDMNIITKSLIESVRLVLEEKEFEELRSTENKIANLIKRGFKQGAPLKVGDTAIWAFPIFIIDRDGKKYLSLTRFRGTVGTFAKSWEPIVITKEHLELLKTDKRLLADVLVK